jgi:hypothetical protein
MSGARKCVFTHAVPMANASSYGSADGPRHPTPNLVSAEFSDVGKPGWTALAACLGVTWTRLYSIEIIAYYYLSLLLRVLVGVDFDVVIITILSYCPLLSSRGHP